MITGTKGRQNAILEGCLEPVRRCGHVSMSMLSDEEDCFSCPDGSEVALGAKDELEHLTTSQISCTTAGSRSYIASICISRKGSGYQESDESTAQSSSLSPRSTARPSSGSSRGNSTSRKMSTEIRLAKLEESVRKLFFQTTKVRRKSPGTSARKGAIGGPLTRTGAEQVSTSDRRQYLECLKQHPKIQHAKTFSPSSPWTKGGNTAVRASFSYVGESRSHLSDLSGERPHLTSLPRSRSSTPLLSSMIIKPAQRNVPSAPFFQSKRRGERSVFLISLWNGDPVDTFLLVTCVLMLVMAYCAFCVI